MFLFLFYFRFTGALSMRHAAVTVELIRILTTYYALYNGTHRDQSGENKDHYWPTSKKWREIIFYYEADCFFFLK